MAYTDQQLLSFLAEPESHWLERKESFSDRDKICKTVCAFANDLAHSQRPGVVFIGVRNDGSFSGLLVDDALLQKIDQIRSDGRIQPLPSLTVRVLEAGGAKVVAIVVSPSLLPPVRFEQRIWVRMSASTQLANHDDERALNERRRANAGRPFDSEAVVTASLKDLDARYFRETYLPSVIAAEILQANGRSLEEQLVTTRMALGPDCVPTAAGLLTVGVAPQDFFPGAYVQFIRYGGAEQGAPILDQDKVTGTLEALIRRTEDKLKAQIRTSVDVASQSTQLVTPDYPLAALQQIFRNAVLHRTYEGTHAPVRVYWFDDRVEIWSPGGPFGSVTQSNFGQPYATDYRNPTIAEALANLGFVQKFGFGIQSAKKSLADNGNPPIEFVVQQGSVLSVIRRKA